MTDEPRIALRRAADLQPAPEPGDDPALVAMIRAEIASSGPMTFARFMDLALYQPDHGYYATGSRGPGREADFLTAPESHPIFGWTVARQLDEVWERLGRPATFTVREYGAGSGALAAGIVEGLTRSGSALRGGIRYRIAERAAAREDQVRARLAAVGADDILEPDDGRPIIGAVIANEVIDALPVHRVVGARDGTVRELLVAIGADGGFESIEGDPSTRDLAARLEAEGVELAAGQPAEVCLEVDGWVAGAAAGLERGLVLLVDYGHPAPALYAPDRGSLLRAYTRHRVHDDPFRNVGRQDLTAHVDLTAVERAATAAGLAHLGTTTQAEFLTGLGAGDLLVSLQSDRTTELGSYLEARSALFRLLDPAATGRFAVMLFGRELAGPPLRGLEFRMARA
ncbi:MAG: SAM-dependent methyltransferase [Chloroflexota bacterium]|nr:MAG: SAM-dependent methyltransferase [Chloroflexota bacterium]